MPLQGILDTARALSYWSRRQEVSANNVANANTDAFKGDRLTARTVQGAEFPVAVRQLDLQQGAFRDTGRPLDVALDGPGFLVVRTAEGERLTRGGSLRLDADGRLVDAHGDPLLGTDGPLTLIGGQLEVQGDGRVLVDGAEAGHLRIVSASDAAALTKLGYGRFASSVPLAPAGAGTHLRQGTVEQANVDALLTMVDLVLIQRAYAANVDAMKTLDNVLGSVTGEVGRVN